MHRPCAHACWCKRSEGSVIIWACTARAAGQQAPGMPGRSHVRAPPCRMHSAASAGQGRAAAGRSGLEGTYVYGRPCHVYGPPLTVGGRVRPCQAHGPLPAPPPPPRRGFARGVCAAPTSPHPPTHQSRRTRAKGTRQIWCFTAGLMRYRRQGHLNGDACEATRNHIRHALHYCTAPTGAAGPAPGVARSASRSGPPLTCATCVHVCACGPRMVGRRAAGRGGGGGWVE